MSMNVLSALQLLGIATAYFISVLGLPWLFFHKYFKRFSIPVKFMAYTVIGNFYIINLVYVLQLLKISYRWTLIAGTVCPFIVAFIIKNRGHLSELLDRAVKKILYFVKGYATIKTIAANHGERIKTERKKDKNEKTGRKKMFTRIAECILTIGIILLVLYIYGTAIFEVYGYTTSDMIVHNGWINEMDNNNIFSDGVYPFGFHCILYYLHKVYGIRTYTLMRLFFVIETLMIHLILLAFMKKVCNNRFVPYLAVAAYVCAKIINRSTYFRYCSALPQEYGMIFILPAVYFLIEFLRRRHKESESQKNNESDIKAEMLWNRPLSDWCIVGFAMSLSLTFTIHFYDTVVAGIFCIGIAVGFCFRFFKWGYLKKILIAGIIGILAAVLPMLAGYASGKGLHGSMYWGVNVIKGADEDKEGALQDDMESVSSEDAETGTLENAHGLKNKINNMVYFMSWLFNGYQKHNVLIAKCIIVFIILIIVLGITGFLLHRTDYGGLLVAVGVYMLLMCIMQSARYIGLPELMASSRCVIYWAYSLFILAGLLMDALIYYVGGRFYKDWPVECIPLALTIIVGIIMVVNDEVRPRCEESGLETNGAIICLENIMNDNEDKNGMWTIVSANDELQMTKGCGWHYETITFLRDMMTTDDDTRVEIPTENVYFYIEKIPIDYSKAGGGGKPVSEEGASMPLYEENSLQAYTGEERYVTMSHMYYWAQEFKKLYPNEMEIYYEDEEFICYRLKQNEYSLYNFAIDYGYNNPGIAGQAE